MEVVPRYDGLVWGKDREKSEAAGGREEADGSVGVPNGSTL